MRIRYILRRKRRMKRANVLNRKLCKLKKHFFKGFTKKTLL